MRMIGTLFVAAVVILSLGPPLVAFQTNSDAEFDWRYRQYLRTEASGAHCGIYAAASAMKALGADVKIEDLMKSEYISSSSGSTAEDLIRLLRDNGFHAKVVTMLNGATLHASQCPIIVHLDKSRQVEGTYHWATYLGEENGCPILFDPPNHVESVRYGDLLAFASGYAILVTKSPIRPYQLWFDRAEAMLWLGIVVAGLFLLNALRKPLYPGIAFCLEWSGLLLLALVVVIGQQFLPWQALLTDRFALGHVREMYQVTQPVESIGISDLEKLAETGNVNIVDARLPQAFGAGHLPNAINWPIDSSVSESRVAWSKIDPRLPTVVYCQGPKCIWDQVIASRLVVRGLSPVFLFDGGWSEWQTRDQ